MNAWISLRSSAGSLSLSAPSALALPPPSSSGSPNAPEEGGWTLWGLPGSTPSASSLSQLTSAPPAVDFVGEGPSVLSPLWVVLRAASDFPVSISTAINRSNRLQGTRDHAVPVTQHVRQCGACVSSRIKCVSRVSLRFGYQQPRPRTPCL
jgi:hypothetical protein